MDLVTKPLYDTREGWQKQPMEAFRGFVLTESYLKSGRRNPAVDANGATEKLRPLRHSTCVVLCQMFGKVDSWLTLNQKSLMDLSSTDILTFLDAKVAKRPAKGDIDMTSTIRLRYLRLLERIYTHMGVSENPASKAAYSIHNAVMKGAAGVDKPTLSLTRAEDHAFLAALQALGADADQPWSRHRDRAMLAVMIGAGLKVSEVIGLYQENIGNPLSDGSISIAVVPAAAGGTSLKHNVTLKEPYAQHLAEWKREREGFEGAGRLLFPATVQGKRISKATLYRQVKATFDRAGLDLPHQGGRTLRNTFAVRELASGTSLEELKEIMGHRDIKTTTIFVPLVDHYGFEGRATPQSG